MSVWFTDNWEEVESSHIKAVGTSGHHLLVEFKNGEVYAYPEMAREFPNLTSAESVGRYFNEHIRDEPFKKIPRHELPQF